MNKFFSKLPLTVKLLIIGLIPIGFLAYVTVELYQEKTSKLKLFENYKNYLSESANINNLIVALQDERKYSFDYAMTKNGKTELLLQRPQTDQLIQQLSASKDATLLGFTSYTKLGELNEIRNKIDQGTIGPNEVMHFYSNTVFRLNTLNTLPPANTAYLQAVYHDLMSQKILSEMITYLGIIRSNIYNVLHTRQYMIETLFGTVGTHDVYLSYESELKLKAEPAILAEYQRIRNQTNFKPTIEYIDTLFKKFSFDDSFTAAGWWEISDEGVNELRSLQSTIWERLNMKINDLFESERKIRRRTLVALILAFISLILVLSYIVSIINSNLFRLKLAAEKISNGMTQVDVQVESNDVVGALAQSISKIDTNNQALAEAAVAIGKGNFDVRLQPRSEGDILGNALVDMKNELFQYNKKMEQLVEQRTEELARSNEDLNQFAHVASHDLKEPLRKISIFCEMLANEPNNVLSEKGKLYLEKIESSSKRMSNMIEGVLAYSTFAVNDPAFELVDLNRTLEGVQTDLEMAIIQRDVTIHSAVLPTINGNPVLLHQLFYNLINNALKFSKPDIPLKVDITSDLIINSGLAQGKVKDFVHIQILDNGIGFNPAFAEKIFGIFSRLNAKDKIEGTGLGLALCRKIVKRHGGKIYAESEEGQWARFHVLLPLE